MRADTITRDSLEFLKNNRGNKLRIHSVFPKAINLIDDDHRLLTLLDNSRDQGPNSIQLNFDTSFERLLPGDLVEASEDGLTFLRTGLRVEVTGLTPDNLTLNPKQICLDADEMAQRFEVLRQVIIDDGNHEGLAPLVDDELPSNHYSQFVSEKADELLSWLAQDKASQLRNGLSGIIGFGPGLTPSTDDFLAGITAVAFILNKFEKTETYHVLLNDLPKIALGKTTTISEEMIRLAAQGKVSHSYKNFLSGLFGRTVGQIPQLARQVIKTGASSGTDFLFGVYSAHTLVQNFLGGNDATSPSQEE